MRCAACGRENRPDSRFCLGCGAAPERDLEADAKRHPDPPIRVRIGLHTGEALRDADEFFGRSVILAARIAAQAAGGEILASALLKELTDSVGDLRLGVSREVALKGFPDPHRVFPVAWSRGPSREAPPVLDGSYRLAGVDASERR